MAQDPALDFQVGFCSLQGAEAAYDPEFARSVRWDVPLLDGYKWTHLPNRSSGTSIILGFVQSPLQVVRTINRAVAGTAVGVFILLLTCPDAFLNRLLVYSETLDPRSPASELLHRTRDYPMANFLAAFTYDRWPYGYGIGTLALGGQYVSRFFHVRPPVGGVESGFGVLVIEMGIGGRTDLWFALAAAILISAWRVVRKLKGSPWFPLAFMIFWYAFVLLIPHGRTLFSTPIYGFS